MNIDQNQYGAAYRNGQIASGFPVYVKSGDGVHRKNAGVTGFSESLAEGQAAADEESKIAESAENTKDAAKDEEPKSYREQILEKMEEMAQNIKRGTIQPKFQIGAQAYIIDEWEELLEKFDAAEEVLREEVKAHIEEIEKQAEREALRNAVNNGTSDTEKVTVASETVAVQSADSTAATAEAAETAGAEETAALLTDEITKCSYPTDDPKQKHWYITCYGQDGISCKEAYFDGTRWVNKDLWSLSYTEKGQYEKVMAFLERFPADANLRFAAHENFWKDFLAGEIDEDDFAAFFATTKDGVPDYTYEKDGNTYIDREKIKYAKYMNDFGARLYTAEEMELIRRAILRENTKNKEKLSNHAGTMTIPDGIGQEGKSEEDDLQTQIVTKPDGSTVLQITTSYGVMELEITQAQKFGLMLDLGRNFKAAGDSAGTISKSAS